MRPRLPPAPDSPWCLPHACPRSDASSNGRSTSADTRAFLCARYAEFAAEWDAIEMVVEIPSASMNDFMGRGGQTRNLCNKIADAAAVPRAYVSCSASAMGMSGRRLDGGAQLLPAPRLCL